jgi:hypothetical protein
MSTLKQKQSSRANGKLSRGPVTAAGKRNSASNGIRHGMLANPSALKGEYRKRFEQVLSLLEAEFQPATEFEHTLVATMAAARWRQTRLWDYERAALSEEIERQAEPAAAFRRLCDTSRVLDRINRFEADFFQKFMRANLQLRASKNRDPRRKPRTAPLPT